MSSYRFTKLLPKDVSFVTGEAVSADKLNGIFNQLGSAFYILESFLGNGTDYRNTGEDNDRKMLFNLSSAIGRTDKLYKPKNRIPELYKLYTRYNIDDYISYDIATDALTISNEVVIPADIRPGDKFGIFYTGQAVVQINDVQIQLPLVDGPVYSWYEIDTTTDLTMTDMVTYFYFKPVSGKSIVIKALYIAEKDIDGKCYNYGYALPLDNKSYYTVKTPCRYSNPAGGQICANRTCDYCIGNTYNYTENDADFGSPICLNAQYTYNPEAGTDRAALLTLQCPLNTTNNKYSLKLRPFSMHNAITDTPLQTNMCSVYDMKDAVTSIKYDISLYSAGGKNGAIRGDIMYTSDLGTIIAGDNRRYIVIGGNYGLVDLMYDMMEFMERPIPSNVEVLGPATYEV